MENQHHVTSTICDLLALIDRLRSAPKNRKTIWSEDDDAVLGNVLAICGTTYRKVLVSVPTEEHLLVLAKFWSLTEQPALEEMVEEVESTGLPDMREN